MSTPPKYGILLLNLGGPDSLEAVKPFLYNLFSDPDIIRFPFSEIFQKPVAWSITIERYEEVQKIYQNLGGSSPLLPLTQAQGTALQKHLSQQGYDLPLYIGMRYWHPFIEEAIDQLVRDGIDHVILLPLYPQYSLTTTGSSVNEFERVLRQKGLTPQISWTLIPPYYNHPGFLQSIAQTIEEGLSSHPWSCPKEEVQLLFSAHSLPEKFVKKYRDPYPDQIRETITLLMEGFFPSQPWELAFQSKVGKMKWLGPPTDGLIHYFAAQGVDNILMVPMSFVSDHLETLYEMDQLYLGMAQALNIPHCYRAASLNTAPLFIETLGELVLQALPSQSRLTPAAI